jgi:hypothetical protein
MTGSIATKRREYDRYFKSDGNRNHVSSVERTTVDLILHLSDQARATRRPGQTLQSRLNELRREVGCG